MNISNFQIRRADISDAVAYEAYVSDIYAEDMDIFPDRGFIPNHEQIKAFYERNTGAHAALFFALADDRIIGRISVSRKEQPNYHHVAGLAITVAKQFRMKGVGRALMERAGKWIGDNDWIDRVELEVVAKNFPAIHLYESFGYEIEGVKRRAMKKKGQSLDLILMARLFNSPGACHSTR